MFLTHIRESHANAISGPIAKRHVKLTLLQIRVVHPFLHVKFFGTITPVVLARVQSLHGDFDVCIFAKPLAVDVGVLHAPTQMDLHWTVQSESFLNSVSDFDFSQFNDLNRLTL